jgi:ATP-dependent DNA ligase
MEVGGCVGCGSSRSSAASAVRRPDSSASSTLRSWLIKVVSITTQVEPKAARQAAEESYLIVKKSRAREQSKEKVKEGAVPAKSLRGGFEKIDLPITPPFAPIEARTASEIPQDADWQFEPKWDGFRCLAFRSGHAVLLQSKAGQPLGRYFPEIGEALRALPQHKFVLDGEIVIEHHGALHFDELLQRIHPAESRIRRLAHETPAKLLAFDMLVDARGKSLLRLPFAERRKELETFFRNLRRSPRLQLSPKSTHYRDALRWMTDMAIRGCDGVIAKRLDASYVSGDRSAMVKIKRLRTADCVVGGIRYASKGQGIGSLLLGLYNREGFLDHVGFCSSFNREQRRELLKIVKPMFGGSGFTGDAPGGPSRWSTERSTEWIALKPELVCEVQYDHFSSNRFRHGTKFLRWRPEKDPRQCTFDQLTARKARLQRSA